MKIEASLLPFFRLHRRAYAQPGEMQPERDFNYQGSENLRVTQVDGCPGRRGWSWFSFDLPVLPEGSMALVVTRSYPQRFIDVEYAIDESFIKGKEKVTVRFEASEGSSISSVLGVRMIYRDKNE